MALPRNRAEVYALFGNPGPGPKADRRWEMANMRTATRLPGRWNKGTGELYVHRLAEGYVRAALETCETDGCLEEIRSLGCFNFRRQRHDTPAKAAKEGRTKLRPLSYHSWGIALDINPADNEGWSIRWPPAPHSPEWIEHYPDGVSPSLVSAFESVGWRWGGRWRGYVDPMHFELTAA